MEVFVLLLSVLALSVCGGSLCILLREFHTETESAYNPPPSKIRIYSHCAILSFLASTIASIVDAATDPSFAQQIINNTAISISWSIGQFFVFTAILTRIHFALKDTKHQLREWNYIIFGVIILICILLCIVWILRSILYYNRYQSGSISKGIIHEFGCFFTITVEVIDVVASIFFIFLFVTKLRVIEHANTKSNTPLRIRKLMTKYWVLALVIIILTQIIYLILCLIFITQYIGADTASSVFTEMFVVLLPVNIVAVCICILLTFAAFEKRYDKWCTVCNDAAISCFAKLEKRTTMLNVLLLENQAESDAMERREVEL